MVIMLDMVILVTIPQSRFVKKTTNNYSLKYVKLYIFSRIRCHVWLQWPTLYLHLRTIHHHRYVSGRIQLLIFIISNSFFCLNILCEILKNNKNLYYKVTRRNLTLATSSARWMPLWSGREWRGGRLHKRTLKCTIQKSQRGLALNGKH